MRSLEEICCEELASKYLTPKFKNRLKNELEEVEIQGAEEYFLDLYERKVRFPENENNLLIPFLLGLVPDVDIDEEPGYVFGDLPDVDVDFNPVIRDYLKNEWAPETYGEDNVCCIGSYTTFGIKNSLIDMARVFDKSRQEILSLTTKIALKDSDGNDMTWDRALDEYPDLKTYCDANPDVYNSARRMTGRIRGMGMHAGGLIVSNQRIDNLVPMVRGKDGQHVSAFVEGLSGTDLGPLGLIKFDLLVVTCLVQIARCCKLIKERYGLDAICSLPGQEDWSDTAYLNDPDALALAAAGQMKGVFQFDSDGIRGLAKDAEVSSFDDLAALSALWRPGPLGMKMDRAFVNRKKGLEEYERHPVLEPILGSTYGVLVYQEQIMKILNVVGNIPLRDCEIIRKAISKKQLEKFLPYQERFIENGMKVLGWSKEKMEELFAMVAEFSRYGFNKSHSVCYTYLSARQLWMKAHYPLEFFATTLECESQDSKIKEYKNEASQFDIEVERLNINKSKENFAIVDDKIYIGFSNIKGIGEQPAAEIVKNQPYASFDDFLRKAGTNSNTIKPLVALRVFDDDDPENLMEYYNYYKKQIKKIESRDKRYQVAWVSQEDELLDFMKDNNIYGDSESARDLLLSIEGSSDTENKMNDFIKNNCLDDRDDVSKTFKKIVKKFIKSYRGYKTKVENEEEILLEKFVPEGFHYEYEDILTAERQFYGFDWKHVLEFSADYKPGQEFEKFANDESLSISSVMVLVVEKAKERLSKKNTKYYTVKVEDAHGKSNMIIFWEDDFLRFKDELTFWNEEFSCGNLLRIRVNRPSPGFGTYTFESPPRHLRKKLIPEDKGMDGRLIAIEQPDILKTRDMGQLIDPGKVLLIG